MDEKTTIHMCIPCSRDKVTTTANWFCSDCQEPICYICSKFHKRNKASSKHKLVQITKDPAKRPINTVSSSDDFEATDRCQDHGYKKFKYFCETHDTFCCSRCAIENHRLCKDLVHISKYTRQEKFASQMMELDRNLAMLSQNAQHIIEYEVEHVHMVRKMQQDEIKKGDDTEKMLVDMVHDVFAVRKTAINQTAHAIVSKSDKMQNQTREYLKEITNYQTLQERAKANSNEAAKAISLKSVTAAEKKLSEKIKECYKNLSSGILSSDLDVKQLENGLSDIATIKARTSSRRKPVFSQSPKKSSTIELSKHHPTSPCLKECCVLDSGVILATDESEKAVRIFSLNGGKEVQCLKVESEPWGISRIDNTSAALSLPFAKKLVFLEMSSGKVSVSTSVDTKSAYFSLASYGHDEVDFLVAYSKTQAQLVRINVASKCEEDMKTPEVITRRNIAPFINHIAVNQKGSQVYLSCYKAHKVFACDFEGQLLWQFSNDYLHTPLGIDVDGNGNIVVCSYDTNRIICINNRGELNYVYISNDELVEPIALAYTKDYNRFAVIEHCQRYCLTIFETTG